MSIVSLVFFFVLSIIFLPPRLHTMHFKLGCLWQRLFKLPSRKRGWGVCYANLHTPLSPLFGGIQKIEIPEHLIYGFKHTELFLSNKILFLQVGRMGDAMPVASNVNVLRTNVFNVYPLRTLRLCGEQFVGWVKRSAPIKLLDSCFFAPVVVT